MTDMRDCLDSLYLDPGDARCIIPTGAGDKAFCAGADLKERGDMSEASYRNQHALAEQMTRALMQCPIPVIAAVNGAAFGGGSELAMGADFIYAVDTAKFAQTECGVGVIPGGPGTQILPQVVGTRRAKEIILGAQPYSAQEALE